MIFKSPALAVMVGGVVAAGLMVRQIQRRTPELDDIPDFPPEPVDRSVETADTAEIVNPRLLSALDRGRRELGQEESGATTDIEFHTALGRSRIRVGYHTNLPFIALRQVVSEETEMTFVVRRRQSSLGLPRVVDNTPVETATVE